MEPAQPGTELVLLGALAALIGLGPGLSAPATAGGGESSQQAEAGCGPAWVGAWHASPVPVREPPAADGRIGGRTIRLVVKPQVDGSAVRIRLSHRYGSKPLVLGAASAGPVTDGPAVNQPVPITFAGLLGLATNAVVLVGDSITDGVGSGIDRDARYSDRLAERLTAGGGDRRMAVLNAGISSNRLHTDRPVADGDPPLLRLPADAETPSRVTDVVLHAGTNDIAAGSSAA